MTTAAGRTPKRDRRDYSIQTVRNCLRVLGAFQNEEELGVTEIARRLELHKNNVFRLLATLQEHGYVEKNDATDCYRLGVSCLELSHAFMRTRTLPALARPLLAELARGTGESAHLAVLSGFEVLHVDAELPERLVVTCSRVAQRLPAHCTALGKALLGCGDAQLLEVYDREIVARGRLRARTGATLVDREKLFGQLHTVRTQGYALDLEECEAGLCCAAAPVHDGRGRVVAALSVSGLAFRLDGVHLEQDVVPAVLRAADRLSRLLGYSGAALP